MFRCKSVLLLGAAVALSLSAAPGLATPAQPLYKIYKTVALGAPGRWDYLHFDPQSGRIYLAHGDRITVANGTTGAILGSITGMPGGTHGIAISHTTGQGFTDDGKAGQAVAFDLKTLKVVKRMKAEPDADGIIYDHASRHIFVIDGDSGKLTVIDPKVDKVIATIDGGGGLEFGVSGDNGKLYINGVEKHEIVRIDTATNEADAHWVMPTCERPRGLAIDRIHERLFSTCTNEKMIVLNADNGAIVATLPIGKGSDAAGFDVTRQLVFSSNFAGTLSVVHELAPNKFETLPVVKTALGARTMALDPKSGRIYLVAANIIVNPSAAPADYHHRYHVAPGSAKLYILEPTR